jgi:arabinofuranosyltransferase
VKVFNRLDIVVSGLLVCVAWLFALHFVNFAIPPFEDAAILMRYADHLAHGDGVVWNVGEPPVDGATDFLFMALVAAVRWTGFSLEASVRGLTIGSHLANVALIYLGLCGVQRAGRVTAALTALYFAVGPGFYLSAAYFGAPCFALAISLAWLTAQGILRREQAGRGAWVAFSLCCLLAGLIRPEGVIYGVLFWLAILAGARGRKIEGSAIFLGILFGLGGLYFLWRWRYFGHPLPSPFYKKGGGRFYPLSLLAAAQENILIALPFLPAFVLAMRSPRTRRLALCFAIPLVGSTLMWGLLSDEMNFGARFQYPTFALICLSWYPLARRALRDLPTFSFRPTAVMTAAFLYGLAAIAYCAMRAETITYSQDGRTNIARFLARFTDGDPVLATTEAGLLPLYSGWKTIDAWGLNDPWIAHHGGVTTEYLAEKHPDLIVIHAGLDEVRSSNGVNWERMSNTLKAYARDNGFVLAAAFCIRPFSVHFYYVRKDMPDSAAIIQGIRTTDYRWQTSGARAHSCVPTP